MLSSGHTSKKLLPPPRFELGTSRLLSVRSDQLSYGGTHVLGCRGRASKLFIAVKITSCMRVTPLRYEGKVQGDGRWSKLAIAKAKTAKVAQVCRRRG